MILTGHSIAEEVAIYPALAEEHQVGHAELAYQEQSAAKMEMGLLERLDPMSEDYLEGTWFLELKKSASPEDQAPIASRYQAEFSRYMGADAL